MHTVPISLLYILGIL